MKFKKMTALLTALSASMSVFAAVHADNDASSLPAGAETRKVYYAESVEDTTYDWLSEDAESDILPMASNMGDRIFYWGGSDYGYRDFSNRSNPHGRRAFYKRILRLCRALMASDRDVEPTSMTFFDETDGNLYVEDIYALEHVNIDAYGLNHDEATEVYYIFRNDHPEYYWLSNSIILSKRTINNKRVNTLSVNIYSEYAKGADRAALNEKITENAEILLKSIADCHSRYDIAKKLHDEIIGMVEYAYDENGNPLDKPYAHGIMGVLDGDPETSVVCEAYAKTYQLLLNYRGIENFIITGQVRTADDKPYENHMWNAVLMEDGKYYRVDLTWDDQPDWPNGIFYRYFMSNESFWAYPGRFAFTPDNMGVYFQYDMPDNLSHEAYNPDTAPTAPPDFQTPTPRPEKPPTPVPTPEPVSDIEYTGAYDGKVEVSNTVTIDADGYPDIATTVTAIDGETSVSGIHLLIAEYDDTGALDRIRFDEGRLEVESSVVFFYSLPWSDRYRIMLWDENNTPVIKAITQVNYESN